MVLDNKMIQIGLGRLNHALLFDTSPIYCSFLSLSICAVPRLMPGGDGDGFYNSAKTNWGSYVRYRPTIDTYIQVGAFESSPLHGGHSGFNFSSNKDVGANFPFQVAWQPGGGAGQPPTHIFAGGYYDTSPYPDVYTDENGNPIGLTGKHGENDHGHTAYWFGADQMIWRNDAPANAGMVLFVNYGATDPHVSLYSDQDHRFRGCGADPRAAGRQLRCPVHHPPRLHFGDYRRLGACASRPSNVLVPSVIDNE